MKLRAALGLLRKAGVRVRYKNRTGEWSVGGGYVRPILVNARKKDASEALMVIVRRAQR
jgi:hypothetical protein